MNERFKNFYLQLFNQIEKWKANSSKRTFVVGINGSQGVGKTILCSHLVQMFAEKNIKAVAISIDDFYITREEQIELSKGGNPYLEGRGYPGTHDIGLGEKILSDLTSTDGKIKIPSYDKSLHEGLGNRTKEEEWKVVEGPVDIILVEGWMLGFTPREDIKDPHLEFINQKLEEYHAWYKYIDAFICLIPEEIKYVLDWRVEAEEYMKKKGKPGMTKEAIKRYTEKFIVAYELYLPSLKPPIEGPVLKIKIGKDRLPVSRV